MFSKYNDIENSYNKKELSKFPSEGFRQYFLVTEKLNGCNFQFHWDGNKLNVGKRSNYIGEGENFYNYEIVLERYKKEIERMGMVLGEFILYGEMFGGNSLGDNKSPYKAIQKGVYYTSDIEFNAFDIKIDGIYLSGHDFLSIMENFDIPIVPIIGTMDFESAMGYDTKFDSKYAGIENNICEGIVIRPLEFEVNDCYGKRLILKKKNEEFKENQRVKKEEIIVDNEMLSKVLEYINRNRLDAVLSKIGEVEIKDFGMIMKEFSLDIRKDFLKENEVDMEEFDKVWKRAGKYISSEIKNYFIGN